jgi:hypothetical protein
MEFFKVYSRTDRRYIIQKLSTKPGHSNQKYLTLQKSDLTINTEDRDLSNRSFIVISNYGNNPNRFQIHTRTIKNKITAVNELEFYQEQNLKKVFYLYEIMQ